MSTPRLVITAVVLEGRSQAEVARCYGVSKGWVSKLVARYRIEGQAAFEPRSRRPKSSPTATPQPTVELIVDLRRRLAGQGHDAGPATIAWHLGQRGTKISPATIARTLTAAALVTPQPHKRPRSSYVRFAAEQPNGTWQADFTHYRLAGGTDVEILTWLDDHSRYALHIGAHPRITGQIVLTAFRTTVAAHGVPASTLTDNGMVFTTRFAAAAADAAPWNTNYADCTSPRRTPGPTTPPPAARLNASSRPSRTGSKPSPTSPTPCPSCRHSSTPSPPTTTTAARTAPCPATPGACYQSLPKALPAASREADTHTRVRHDRIDDSGVVTLRHNGRLHHIGIGRTHARTHIVLLVADRHIRIVNALTGELLRELTLNPDRDYQPQTPKNP